MSAYVIDSSVTMAWCFPDESSSDADAILDELKASSGIVPPLRPLEVANVLVIAERRRRLTTDDSQQFLDLLARLPISIDAESTEHVFDGTIGLARSHGLTAYDAAYLELALRLSLPLCTLDEALKQTASSAGASLFTA